MDCNVKNYQLLIIRQNFRELKSFYFDVFNDTFTSIQIDDEELYNQTKDYLQEIAPSKQSIVKFYQSNDTPF
jgi:Ribonuclease G/E